MRIRNAVVVLGFALGLTSLLPAQIVWQKGDPPDYQFDAIFDSVGALPHGIVVDGHNRVWIGSFSASAPGLLVKNPDGSEASFSPITSLTFGGEIVPLDDGGCRGMTVDHEGNILYAKGNTLIKIDATDGQGIARWEGPGSLMKPAVDAAGNVYVGTVVGVSPIRVLEPVFFSELNSIELTPVAELARGIEVTADGRNIWTGNLDFGGPVYQYTSDDFVTYPVADSILVDADGDTIFQFAITTADWGPDSTLWFSHETEEVELQAQNGLVILDFKSETYSTLFMPDLGGNEFNGPRGVAFSVTADTAYVASFNGGRVARFVRGQAVSVRDFGEPVIPLGFELGQNYPNPFNPTTAIPFRLSQKGQVLLKIYNIQGQEITTLINRVIPSGEHEVTFDASALASGAYYYTIYVGGRSLTKKMLVTK